MPKPGRFKSLDEPMPAYPEVRKGRAGQDDIAARREWHTLFDDKMLLLAEFYQIELDDNGEPYWQGLARTLARNLFDGFRPKRSGRPRSMDSRAGKDARRKLLALVDGIQSERGKDSMRRSVADICKDLAANPQRLPAFYKQPRKGRHKIEVKAGTLNAHYFDAKRERNEEQGWRKVAPAT